MKSFNMPNPYFKFKQFTIFHDKCAMKVGTDGVLLGSWAGTGLSPKRILDIGAGSGLIALMLAQRFKSAEIDAVEIEAQCAQQCAENALASPFKERINSTNSSIQEFALKNEDKFDLLVSNPPFFIDSFTSDNDQRNTARHNHSLRQHDLLKVVTDLSHHKSVFAIILPVKEGDLFILKAREYPWYLNNQVYIKGSPESKEKRVLLEFTKSQNPLMKSQLIVEEKRGVYTKGFTALVKDFYLHL
jgi:tRNA1Val (adenine37-N6)-methyltransferase